MPAADEIRHVNDPLDSRFWFKVVPESGEITERTLEVVRFLEARGEVVRVLRTTDPGHITYGDIHQLAAERR